MQADRISIGNCTTTSPRFLASQTANKLGWCVTNHGRVGYENLQTPIIKLAIVQNRITTVYKVYLEEPVTLTNSGNNLNPMIIKIRENKAQEQEEKSHSKSNK